MSTAILSAGSTEPPKVAGKHRVYGLNLSPSTQQVLLVLITKNVPYDLVNINPKNIPDWYTKIQPEGKFPALHTGDQLLVGTQAIVEYIDDKFPEPALYPAGTDKKAVLTTTLQKLEPLAAVLQLLIKDKNSKAPQEVHDMIGRLSERLKTGGTPYLGGNSPGAPDFMIWPWIRAGIIQNQLQSKDKLSDEKKTELSGVIDWIKSMEKVKAVQDILVPVEEYVAYLK